MFIVNGIEKVDYISKKTNNRVLGYNIYVSEQIDSKYGFGDKSERVYISMDKVSNITDFFSENIIGTEVDFTYNKYGNVSGVIIK